MTAPRPVEVELKYRVRGRRAAARLLEAAEIAGFAAEAAAAPVDVEDRYIDTANLALDQAGLAARLRNQPDGTLISLKSTATTAGALQRRQEIEGPATPLLEPATWPPSAARTLVLEHSQGAPLIELARVRQSRRRRMLREGDTRLELTIDAVEVLAGERVVDRFTELEVELRHGPESALDRLAAVFDQNPDLEPSGESKLERARVAIAAASAPSPEGEVGPSSREAPEAPPGLIVGKTPGVTPEDTLAEAGRKVLRFHLARMIARERGVREGGDPEELHGMRVATRRMRAAWRVFGDAYRADRSRRIRGRLRDVATHLGEVRDLDVLIEATRAYQDAQPETDQAGLEPLLAAWAHQRENARLILLHELDDPRYRRFVDDFRGFVTTEGLWAVPPATPTDPIRIRDLAGSHCWLAYERVRAYESVLRWADVPTLHQLRIEGKRLRYTLEFFREALGPDVGRLIPRVVALQDHLGYLHDADVAAHLARAFLVEEGGRLSESESAAIGRFLRSREKELERLRRSVGPVWRGVAGLTFRRALGRAIAAL